MSLVEGGSLTVVRHVKEVLPRRRAAACNVLCRGPIEGQDLGRWLPFTDPKALPGSTCGIELQVQPPEEEDRK